MERIAAFNDIATGVATSIMAILATLGLNTWRHQLRGTANYELARRLLRAIYRVRDEIARVRSPFMGGGETAAAVTSSGEKLPEDFDSASKRSYELAYEARWRRLVETTSDLDAELIEAEVLWGSPAVSAAKDLRAVIGKLSYAVTVHLRSRRNEPRGEKERERVFKQESILWAGGASDGSDAFSDEVVAVVNSFEVYLRPKLTH